MHLLAVIIFAFFGIFTWFTLNKAQGERAQAQEENDQLREKQKDMSDTRCTVCLDNPREVLLQTCGHVCMCKDCASRYVYKMYRVR